MPPGAPGAFGGAGPYEGPAAYDRPPAYGPGGPYEQPPAYGTQPPAPGWEAPEPEPAAPAPPVATNGHTEDTTEVSARSTTVALVDAGPFDDLIQLRHFEDDLASLTAVRDVRVRRFGHGRASIEVGMTGPYALSRELYRLDRQMSVSDGDAGDLVIDLAPRPEHEPDGDFEAEPGEDAGGEITERSA